MSKQKDVAKCCAMVITACMNGDFVMYDKYRKELDVLRKEVDEE